MEKYNGPDKNISRRKALKIIGGGLAAIVGKKIFDEGKYAYDSINYKEEDNLKEAEKVPDHHRNVSAIQSEYSEKEIPPEDAKAAKEAIGSYDQPANVDRHTKTAIEKHWRERYESDMKSSLDYAYESMQPYLEKLKEIFRTEFWDLIRDGKIEARKCEDLAWLAIPESHWNWSEDSPKNARGPYQIVKSTGRKFGLHIEEKVKINDFRAEKRDQRLDIHKSARAAAQALREIYNRTMDKNRDGDMDVALSGYNGGYVNEYLGQCHQKKCQADYGEFAENMATRINSVKKYLWSHDFVECAVSAGDSLEKFAEFYGIKAELIAKKNHLKKNFRGRYNLSGIGKLTIPFSDPKDKKRFHDKVASGFIENLNYPAKYNAVMSLIHAMEEGKKEELARKKLSQAYAKTK